MLHTLSDHSIIYYSIFMFSESWLYFDMCPASMLLVYTVNVYFIFKNNCYKYASLR